MDGTTSNQSEEQNGEQQNWQQQQQQQSAASVNASPVPHHKTLSQAAIMDSLDQGGSDRDTDKEGSVTDDSRPRRPVTSIRRRVLQSANSSNVEQPTNSSPGQTPRRFGPSISF